MRLIGVTHKCPHPDCTVQVDTDVFACSEHWRRLPVGLRHLINKRYREFIKFRSTYHLAALRNIQAEGIAFFERKKDQPAA